jgi:hypothetical protein
MHPQFVEQRTRLIHLPQQQNYRLQPFRSKYL